ncbi:unnamed protein product [Vicia faba]|uniref:Uncharacterized protein n=1 Tax=Vicia faba TaxID=3906 RepID=A0AAV0YU17_VICFA|nr:unnamed protein product [Vicia faba]
MAPKRNEASKKQKTSGAGTSREEQTFDQTRFIGPEQEERYTKLVGRSIWYERIFDINLEGTYKSLPGIWTSQKWDKLLNPHHKINTEVLQEFYANAFPSKGTASFSTKVGGRMI